MRPRGRLALIAGNPGAEDAAAVLHLDECIHLPLERWILSFAHARVLAPASRAQRIRQKLEQTRSMYLSGINLEMARMTPTAIGETRAGGGGEASIQDPPAAAS